jgi:hypothetical protein
MKFQLSVSGWYKETLGQNFHQYFNVEKIDHCSMMKIIETVPWFNYFIYWANTHLPGVVKPCPFTGVSN